jgi:hypothetical protein
MSGGLRPRGAAGRVPGTSGPDTWVSAGKTAAALRLLLLAGLGGLLACVPTWASASPWVVRLDDSYGLPLVERGGAPVLTANFAYWDKNWKWAEQATRFAVDAPGMYRMDGVDEALGFRIRARITTEEGSRLRWAFDMDSGPGRPGAIGGGLVFHLNLARAQLGEPELLPENAGWAWGKDGLQRLEFRVDPAAAAVYFERGHKDEIRVFFFKDSVPAGRREFVAELKASGNVEVRETHLERFGAADTARWRREAIEARPPPVDLSFLNADDRPAGRHGFVRVSQARLAFEDGVPARFWGTNVAAYAIFSTSKEQVRLQAKRLAALGFNLVRLHHHDSPWVTPNLSSADPSKPGSTLDESSLDRLDWWVYCLKQEGIYVWLDLHVQRALRKADKIQAFDEISAKGGELKGFNYVNESVRDSMRDFNFAYLTHRNPYTGLRYVDERAVAALLITNENDLTHHFGNALLPDKAVPWHSAAYLRQANEFAARYDLAADRTWRSWEDGPSKLFLNDLEHRFDADMIAHLRRIGVKVPIVTTSYWGGEPLSSLPALATGDAIDAHSYGGVDELSIDPQLAANLIDWISAAHVAGKPLTVSEWNVVAPGAVPDRHALPLYIASEACLQGWDALMQFAYAQLPPEAGAGARDWNSFNDPGLMSTMPAAALAFRRQHVREADSSYVLEGRSPGFFDEPRTPDSCAALRTATQRGKFLAALPATRQLPWLHAATVAAGARMMPDPGESVLPKDSGSATSDTGELHRDWEQGIFTVETPLTQAAMGWIGGRRIELSDVVIAVDTPSATVAVQSLDGAPLGESRRILVSVGARAVPVASASSPYATEPVHGSIAIRSRQDLRVFALSAGGIKREMAAGHDGGRRIIDLGSGPATSWLLLE